MTPIPETAEPAGATRQPVEEAAEAVVATRRALTAATRRAAPGNTSTEAERAKQDRKLAENAHLAALEGLRAALVAERSTAPRAADAAEWLEDYLTSKGGTGELREIKAAGHKAEHSEESLRKAREQLRVVTMRRGYPARILWSLSAAAALVDHGCVRQG